MLGAISLQKEFMRKKSATLTIHGPNEDPSREELKKLIENYQISDLVSLEGEVWGEEKKKAFLSADYFIQTSRSEGMPMGLLEAMAHGLPAIVTEGTGFSDIVSEKQCGFGCKTSKEDIALAIKEAIEAKESYQTHSQNARTLVKENYEEKKVAKETLSAYRTLLS